LSDDQISILTADFRKSKLLKMDEYEEFKKYLKTKIRGLKTVDGILSSMYVFQKERPELLELDELVLKQLNEWKKEDLLKLISLRSIIRQPNVKINRASSFRLQSIKEEFKVDEIKTCFLSYATLSYNDEELFTRLLNDLNSQIDDDVILNTDQFHNIILSIGMMGLRHESLLNKICNHLVLNKQKYPNSLLSNFITSCGNVNFSPENIDKLIAELNINQFKFEDDASAIRFLNLTLALCQLEKPNRIFIETVLSEKFWSKLLSGKSPRTEF
jgi:hypothetical protein